MIASATASVFGGEPPAIGETSPEISVPTSKPRWSVSSGIRARSVSGDFALGSIAPSGFSLGSSVNDRTGRGDVGLFKGGIGTVTYDDGSVGPAYGTQDGDGASDGSAYSTINSQGQLATTGRYDVEGDEIFDLSFHSSSSFVRSSSGYSPGGFRSSDDEVVASPYIEFRYAIVETRNWGINLVAGYSFARAGLGSGAGALGTAFNRNTTVVQNYTYTYDHFAFNSGAIGTDYPFKDTESATIYDAGVANGPGGYTQNSSDSQAPRTTTNRSRQSVDQEFTALGSANMNVDLHEVLIAAEVTYQLNERFHLTAAVGPTLNMLSSDMVVSSGWYQGAKRVSSSSSNTDETSLKLGLMAQLGVRYFLSPEWFLEANGGYRYVPQVTTGSGIAESNIDASSWTAGVGVGFIF